MKIKVTKREPKKPTAGNPIGTPGIAIKKMPENQEDKIDNEQPQLQQNAEMSTAKAKRPMNGLDEEHDNSSSKKSKLAIKPNGKEEQKAEDLIEPQSGLRFDLDSINKDIFPLFDKLKLSSIEIRTQSLVDEMISIFTKEEDLTKVCTQTHFTNFKLSKKKKKKMTTCNG